ncbi:MAG: hemerythrin domain-containing protein [Chloracidobacterium sp.]|nr:hemerythrin domain-containing protein [Chloracidobacterium sp.]
MTYIKDLKNVHILIDEMFFDHQKALLHFEFDKALTLLEMYQTTLIRHMQDEELILLPVYADRAKYSGAGAPKLFFDDHEKMRSFVELFIETTAELKREPDIDKALLQLLDREAFYTRLCSHHDRRETEFLYPILEEILTDVEKRDLLAQIDLSAEARICPTPAG